MSEAKQFDISKKAVIAAFQAVRKTQEVTGQMNKP